MKKMILLTIGGAVGFVLGARAGRPTYDRMQRSWADLTQRTGLGDLATTAKDAAVDVRDLAVDRASQAVSKGADDVAQRIDDLAPSTNHSAQSPLTTNF